MNPSETAGFEPYRLARRDSRPERTVVRVGDSVELGGDEVVLMAGPCAVESAAQLRQVASRLARAGVRILRGGAFKPRTSPYAFQGLGDEGYRILREVADEHGMKVVSEILSERSVEAALECVDLLQVGSRNMQNFALLKELASVDRPVLLKRGMSASYDELLGAAEYLLAGGNDAVALCERGIRTFETRTRNTLDVCAVPMLKQLSHLPVVVDPSHAAGRSEVVPDLSRAAVAAGADGLLIEVHERPAEARSDGAQALRSDDLVSLLPALDGIARAVGRRLTRRDEVLGAPAEAR
ncbi:MAG: 3-deoxy-7-phosphoheptulonate synthase [Planctomycetota bacterium JB042]